jgi:hypothetical protein
VPVTDGDALCYHLQVPKLYLEKGAAVYEPDLHETVYPLGVEMLFAVALAFRGPVACRLVSWLLGVVLALSVTALARPWLGRRARWAGAIALGVPAVSNGMGAPLNDVALAAFGNAALLAWCRWRDRPSARAAALAGALAGLAVGVKYPALVWAGVLGLAAAGSRVLEGRRAEDRGQIIIKTFLFAIVLVLVGGPWYARAYHFTGNPVHPFFRGTFGGAGLDEVLDPIKRPLEPSPWNLATALGPLTLEPDRFDSLAHQLGPAFLLLLPGLLLARPPRRVAAIVGMGLAFVTICLCVRQSTRFLLIAVGPLSLGVAWLTARWADRPTLPARALLALVVGVVGLESALALARARHGIGVVLGRESPDSYLARREPTYRVGRWIDAHLPGTARLVGQDHRGYYIPRPYAMELAHRRRTGLASRGESAEEIVDHLRRQHFTHLLLCPPEPIDAVEFDPTLSDRLAPWLARRRPLYREAIRDPDGVVRRFAIYDLAPEVADSDRKGDRR